MGRGILRALRIVWKKEKVLVFFEDSEVKGNEKLDKTFGGGKEWQNQRLITTQPKYEIIKD